MALFYGSDLTPLLRLFHLGNALNKEVKVTVYVKGK